MNIFDIAKRNQRRSFVNIKARTSSNMNADAKINLTKVHSEFGLLMKALGTLFHIVIATTDGFRRRGQADRSIKIECANLLHAEARIEICMYQNEMNTADMIHVRKIRIMTVINCTPLKV